jgi:hypothetical protein
VRLWWNDDDISCRAPVLSAVTDVNAQTALRAAGGRLEDAGLVTLRRATRAEVLLLLGPTARKAANTRGVSTGQMRKRYLQTKWSRRTLLGDAVVAVYRDVLETPSARLRWDARFDEALAGANYRCLCHHQGFAEALALHAPRLGPRPWRW